MCTVCGKKKQPPNKPIIKKSPILVDMAAFSTVLSKYCILIWFSHIHSLDVQAALSLRGWMQDMKHGNEILEKNTVLDNVKILKIFLCMKRWQLFHCMPLMSGESHLLTIVENELDMNNGRQRYCYTHTTYSLLKEYWHKWLWFSGIKTFLSAHYIKELMLSEQGLFCI